MVYVNSPSQAGVCMRSRYYARVGVPSSSGVDARTRRIFDNGTGMHERIQKYLTNMGVLLLDEAPTINQKYKIQGHTDGIISVGCQLAILELKSMNSFQFAKLDDIKADHKLQGLVYLFCIEERRKHLLEKYSAVTFKKSLDKRREYYASLYQHVESGRRFNREEKIAFQCLLHEKLDNILFYEAEDKPITKVYFVYENKDTQDLKEFVLSSKSKEAKELLSKVLNEYTALNAFVDQEEVPERQGRNKSDNYCRWCNYKQVCWEK